MITDDRKAQSPIIFDVDDLPIKWNVLFIGFCEKNRTIFSFCLQGDLRIALHAGEYVYICTHVSQPLSNILDTGA